MRRIATVCARGGSKGVKDKNLRTFAGQPLVVRTVAQALESRLFEAVVVSSDSERILAAVAAIEGIERVRRPDELASDAAPKLPVIRHAVRAVEALRGVEYDVIVDLAVTSPLRAVQDIEGAVAQLEHGDAANVLSAFPAPHSPYYTIVERGPEGFIHYSKLPPERIFRRQDAPECFVLNGAVYVWRRAMLFSDHPKAVGDRTEIYVMPEERSIDIDSELDLVVAELLHARVGGARHGPPTPRRSE